MTTAMLAVHPENEIIHARTMMMSMPPQQPCPHHHNVHESHVLGFLNHGSCVSESAVWFPNQPFCFRVTRGFRNSSFGYLNIGRPARERFLLQGCAHPCWASVAGSVCWLGPKMMQSVDADVSVICRT